MSKGLTVWEEMVGQSATREREQYQGPPPARKADFKEQAEGNNTSSRGSRARR